MAEKIKIRNVAKFSLISDPKLQNLWEVENELDADEIRSVIQYAASQKYVIKSPSLPNFHYYYWAGSQGDFKFAAYNENDLRLEERKYMINAEPGCFENYLERLNLDALQEIYNWLVQNGHRTHKKGMQVKKSYLDEILIRLEDLANHTVSTRYASNRCIALGAVEQENKGGVIVSDEKRLIFAPERISTFSNDVIQYWKLTDLRFPAVPQSKSVSSLEFFKGTKSVINISDSTNHCILNLKEPEAMDALQEFVFQQEDEKNREFALFPLTLRVGRDLLHDKYFQEPEKFRATWPNNRAALAEKFGTPRKKTKFETLKLGLLLSDQLEQVQKVVKALSGQKIALCIHERSPICYFHLGEVLSASVIEALILHLKIDYIVPNNKNLVFCEVRKKITEEMLAFIWQMAEERRLPSISFSGFQLTE